MSNVSQSRSSRAGVAIDSANWVSGAIVNPDDESELNSPVNQKWNRIPFEAIIDPASHLTPNSLIIENDLENFYYSTASVGYIDPKYALAASNFYAGVVDTFVQNSTLTSIQSAHPSHWTFSSTGSLFTNYTMDIVISKNSNFTNHDDPSANGFPYYVHSCFYQPLNSSTGNPINWFDAINATPDGIRTRANDDVQPNASWGYNEATITIDFNYSAFRSAVSDRDPNLNDILLYSKKSFNNKGMTDDDLTAFLGESSSSFNSPYMTIEAGVDLFASNNDGQWTPTLRWECPTHNFVNTTALFPDGTDGGDGTSVTGSNRGVWHQYSTDTNSGLKLFARGPSIVTGKRAVVLTKL